MGVAVGGLVKIREDYQLHFKTKLSWNVNLLLKSTSDFLNKPIVSYQVYSNDDTYNSSLSKLLVTTYIHTTWPRTSNYSENTCTILCVKLR